MTKTLKDKEQKHFFPLHNQSIDINSNVRLSPDQLYVYAFLYNERKYYNDTVNTNIDLLHQLLPVFYQKRDAKNKGYIRDILLHLREIDLIRFDINDNFKYDTLLTISFNMGIEGFEKMDTDTFYLFSNPNEFYVYSFVYRWRNVDCKMSYGKWAEYLNCSKKTAFTLINSMCERKIIYRKSGSYKEDMKQEVNLYNITPFPDVEEKETKQTVVIEEVEQPEESKSIVCPLTDKSYTEDEIIHKIKNSHWGKKGQKINDDDYSLYRLCKDNGIQEKFTKQCDNTMKFISEKFKVATFEKFESEYDYLVDRKHEEEIKKEMEGIIRKVNDVVLWVNDEFISYSEYKGQKVDTMYYLYGHYYISEYGDYAFEVRSIKNPSQKKIEFYRPINGRWKTIEDIEPEEEIYISPDSWEITK